MVDIHGAAPEGAGTEAVATIAKPRKRVNGAAKGATFERRLADYFVELGYIGARRMIRTGTTKHADEGDLDGLPFTVQAKSYGREVTDAEIKGWSAEAADQAKARNHLIGIVVIKRNGHAAIGKSWVYTSALELSYLSGVVGRIDFDQLLNMRVATVRISLDDFARMLTHKYPPGK